MPNNKRHALLVGVNSHQSKAWAPLSYVKNDIYGENGLLEVLKSDLGSRNYSKDCIIPLIDSVATSLEIEDKLKKLCILEATEGENEVFFYFSGHCIIDKALEAPLLVTYDTDPKNPLKSGLTFETLNSIAKKTRAKLIVVIDTCFSGKFITESFSDSAELVGSAAERFSGLPNVEIFASCQADQTSGATPGHTRSLFTSLLINGLRGEGCALNAGKVTTQSLKNYLVKAMLNESQTPVIHLTDKDWILSIPHTPIGVTISTNKDFPWLRYLESNVLRHKESKLYSRQAFEHLQIDETSFTSTDDGQQKYISNTNQNKIPALNALEKLVKMRSSVAILLGDVGSGKSTVVKRFWYNLAQKAISDPDMEIPVEVPLSIFRDIRFDEVIGNKDASEIAFRTASSRFRAILMDLFQYEYGVSLVWPEVELQIKSGKLVIIFDGLDEMGVDSRVGAITNCLRILCRYAELGAFVVITCRTHFLRNDDELENALCTSLKGALPFSFLKLQPFTIPQITHYVEHMSESEEDAKLCNDILHNAFHGSHKLATRPFLLEILVKTVKSLSEDAEQHKIKEYIIFKHFLKGWLERDRWRFSRFLSDYRDAIERDVGLISNREIITEPANAEQGWAEGVIVHFIELLANDLRIEGVNGVSYLEIPARIRAKFPAMPEVFLNFFEYTLRTCSFLNRDSLGEYRFLHESIQSYFAARAILCEIRRDNYPWDLDKKIKMPIPHSLGKRPIDEIVKDFLLDMIIISDYEKLEKMTRYKENIQNPNTLRYLAGNCLVLRSSIHRTLDGCDLQKTYICGVDLHKVSLKKADLRLAIIENVNFEESDLSGAMIEGAKINKVKFGGTKFTGVIVNNGSTVIVDPIGFESAKEVPSKVKEIVEMSGKGRREYHPIIADDCDMKLIEGGRFLMGAHTNDSNAELAEKPAHEVKVDSFYLDEHPVTNKQFYRFVEANPDWGKEAGIARTGNVYYLSLWKTSGPPPLLNDHPVVYVNWFAAVAYAEWAGKRLPTEAEWEFALRDKNHIRCWPFPWGQDEGCIPKELQDKLMINEGTYDWHSMQHNSYGIYDLTGNVNEWVQDWHDPTYYQTLASADEVPHNPKGPPFGREKVLRGGSFLSNNTRDFRCCFRRFLLPGNTNQDGGFRCAKNA